MKVAASVHNSHPNQKKQVLLPLVPTDNSEELADAITQTCTMDTDPPGGNGAKCKRWNAAHSMVLKTFAP